MTNDIATSAFVRWLSAFDEPVVRVGREADYTEAIQLLSGYFVQQKWIAPSVKPVIVSEYCSLVTKLRSDKFLAAKDWVETFSCHYELQSRAELFDLFKVCCEALRGPCLVPPPFTVSIPGLRSDAFEFSSCVRSLQCSWLPSRSVKICFCLQPLYPVPLSLWRECQDLSSKGNFLCGISYLPLISSKLACWHPWRNITQKVVRWRQKDGLQLTTGPAFPLGTFLVRAVKTVAERKIDSTPIVSPVVQRLTEVPVIPDRMVSGSKQKKRSSAIVLLKITHLFPQRTVF